MRPRRKSNAVQETPGIENRRRRRQGILKKNDPRSRGIFWIVDTPAGNNHTPFILNFSADFPARGAKGEFSPVYQQHSQAIVFHVTRSPVTFTVSHGIPGAAGSDRTFAGRTCPIWGEAGGPRRLADVGGVPGAGFGGTAGGGSQILAVHRSCFPRFPAACGRFEPADPLVSRFGASSTRSLTFAPRSEPPRGRAPGAQTIWMRPG
eukprot:gene24845-biopygen10471